MAAANIMDKYKGSESEDPSKALEFHQQLMDFKPEWAKYDATKNSSQHLDLLQANEPAMKKKAILMGNLKSNSRETAISASLDVLSMQDDKPKQWILTIFCDMLREDSSCFEIFEEALKLQIPLYKSLMGLLGKSPDSYVADKAAWLLTSIMGNSTSFFNNDDFTAVLKLLFNAPEKSCTDLGVLDAVCNLLKAPDFRGLVWNYPGVPDIITKFDPRTASSPYVYKCVFAIWMLSFDEEVTKSLKSYGVIKQFKEILTVTRVEKVVRMSLTALTNFLQHKSLSEEIVEEGMLEAVQQLEFEKWRDAELYDDIKEMSSQISSEVSALSNFDRYERELQTGQLQWGFIHSGKFWAENVMKFEQKDFAAMKELAQLLSSQGTDPTTLAVACHDIGEFVALHPMGRKHVLKWGVKERVMELMTKTFPQYREVRREALLCCQKIMLNKWQDVEASK